MPILKISHVQKLDGLPQNRMPPATEKDTIADMMLRRGLEKLFLVFHNDNVMVFGQKHLLNVLNVNVNINGNKRIHHFR